MENKANLKNTEEDGDNSDPEKTDNATKNAAVTLLDENSMTMMNCVQIQALPDEIIEFILTYLPPYKDLENCSLVCKRWHQIVKNLIRRAKHNLQKGLMDFRLRWEVYDCLTSETERIAKIDPFPGPGPGPIGFVRNSALINSVIAGRFSHSAVRYGNSMYIFGGGSSSDTTFNDLWRFNLSETRWERPVSMGSYPSPKGSASMVCWKNQLVLFGGWRYPSLHPPYQPWCLFDELHFYDIESNRWTVKQSIPGPPAMAGHSATVHGDLMVIFGGYQIADGVNSNSNQTWCLDLKDLKWWQPKFANSIKPPPRYGQIQMDLDKEHILLVGGCGGVNSIYSDAWLLDMSKPLWSWRTLPVRNKKFGASHMWCNPACRINSKLVVLGPTPNMPHDLSMMKHIRMPAAGANPAAPGVPPMNNRLNPVVGREAILQAGRNIPGADNIPMRNPQNRLDNLQRVNGREDQYYAVRRAILNQHQGPAVNLFNNNNNNNNNIANNINASNLNNNLQPRRGSLRELHNQERNSSPPKSDQDKSPSRPTSSACLPSTSSAASTSTSSSNSPSASSSSSISPSKSLSPPANANQNGNNVGNLRNRRSNDIEAANRLQRNLALRSRDNEPLLPKRFDELYEDPIRMAAFDVPRGPRPVQRDHNERIRRMEEKMNALRNSRRNIPATANNLNNSVVQKQIKEPSPKRAKRNVLSLFVCDLAKALDPNDPYIEWIEYKNYGIIPGAPERLILSTMVPGNGELILFGGVHKETLSDITHHVSNCVHFLSAPKDIV